MNLWYHNQKYDHNVFFDAAECWDLAVTEESNECGVELYRYHASTRDGRNAPPPRLKLELAFPEKDCQVRWIPAGTLAESHHYLPRWWNGAGCKSNLTYSAPVVSFFNTLGENRLTVALSDALHTSRLQTGAHHDDKISVIFHLFDGTEQAKRDFTFILRIDRRNCFYAKALADTARWFESFYPPLPVPSAAFESFYSTWYQYQKAVSAVELAKELPLLRETGFSGMILDDGWQCKQTDGGGLDMTTCGEWRPFPGKFPNLPGLIAQFQRSGMRFLLWIGTPYIGNNIPGLFERFHNMVLNP
ncbi:MAG: alpha-galactosidase [Victivallaceae bacterium]|nr:alpha-galactosidase [Victivallaceae bacterium]